MKENSFTRRAFVKTSTLAAISIAPVVGALSKVFGASPDQTEHLIDCGFRLTNWKSLLNLEFYFVNVNYRDNGFLKKRKIFSDYGQEESYMIVRLPQQHIAEQSYSLSPNEVSPPKETKDGKGWTAITMISGYSYLVFRIMFNPNENRKKIPLTDEALMDWNNQNYFKLVVKQNLTESLFEIITKEKHLDGQGKLIVRNSNENKYPLGYDKWGQTNDANETWELFDNAKTYKALKYQYNHNKFPKAYGDPITALEFPWRLILSPKLPDQDRFKWSWEFSKKPPQEMSGKIEAELWTASLTITENPEYFKLLELKKENQTKEEKENSQKNELDEIIKKIELMIIGNADTALDAQQKKNIDDIFETGDTYFLRSDPSQTITKAEYISKNSIEQENYYCKNQILPKVKDRKDLLELYIKYKLVARADKITFSPIGVSTFLELKNSKIEETTKESSNDLFSWKQLISFGRDEEVEIIRLFLDKEFGHKWLHIFTTKRRTKDGLSYLDYREYIMPLEVEKDYTKHLNEKLKDINNSNGYYSTSKFNTPFKNLKLLETKPKRILPLKSCTEGIKNFANDSCAYIPQVFDVNDKGKHDFVEFQYLATDWQNQTVAFRKKIQAVQFNAFDYINKIEDIKDASGNVIKKAVDIRNHELQEIEKLFSSNEIDRLEKDIQSFSIYFKSVSQSLAQLETEKFKPSKQLERFKNLITSNKTYYRIANSPELPIINDALISYLEDFNTTLEIYNEEISKYKATLKSNVNSLVTFIESKTVTLDITQAEFETLLTNLENQINLITEKELFAIKESLADKFNELSFKDIRSSIIVEVDGVKDEIKKVIKEKVYDAWNKIYEAEKAIPNRIRTYRQKIGYAIEDFKTEEQKLLNGIKDEVSNLETDYLVFKGELKREFETSTLDFFNQYASLPQLNQAKAYVKSLNKLVNEEIPIGIKYAKDYLNNQIDLTKLEVEKNASRVFLEVTESSKEYLKGKIRQVASDMGGYINPEIPVEYLTYLKDPKQIPNTLKKEIDERFKDEFTKDKAEFIQSHPELKQYYDSLKNAHDDLVFISHEAKEQWNNIKQIQPDAFFKGLEAKILGSISLKDILGLDFEVPRLSELPDKIVYNFQTDKIQDKEFSIVKFYAKNAFNKGNHSTLQVYLEKKIKNPNEYKSFTKLSDFTVGIRLASEDVLLIYFNKLEVSSSNSVPKKTEVKLDNVSFGGPLNFLGKLAEAIKIPGSGLRVQPSFTKVEIGYTFTLPSIETPAFNLANLKFDIGLIILFPTTDSVRPISTTFSINRPDDKFLVTVGIFGGRGHFVMEATPNKIIGIDASIEFGGYLGINLGIASGQVYLFAGIRYQCYGGDITFTGYLICGGGVTVFGFISVSVTFLLAMTYQNIGGQATLYGSASVSYCIKIAFFKKSFTLSYSKRLAGAKGKTADPNSDGSTAYIEHTEEPVYYASTSNELMLLPSNSNVDTNQANEVPIKDIKSFKTIYPKNSGLWEQYCNSFNF